jgi:hypothetical protein
MFWVILKAQSSSIYFYITLKNRIFQELNLSKTQLVRFEPSFAKKNKPIAKISVFFKNPNGLCDYTHFFNSYFYNTRRYDYTNK